MMVSDRVAKRVLAGDYVQRQSQAIAFEHGHLLVYGLLILSNAVAVATVIASCD